MATSPLDLPSFPPANPWEVYVVFVLWLPLMFRLFILAKPMRQVINNGCISFMLIRRFSNPLSWKSVAVTCR